MKNKEKCFGLACCLEKVEKSSSKYILVVNTSILLISLVSINRIYSIDHMSSAPQLPSSSRLHRHLMVYRQVQLQKGILHKKNRSSLPASSMVYPKSLSSIFNSTLNSQQCSNLHLTLNLLKDKTLQNGNFVQFTGAERYKIVRRSINWRLLDESQQRPRFNRWERKFVNKLANAGKNSQVMKLFQ